MSSFNFEQLDRVVQKYNELSEQLMDQELMRDAKRLSKIAKERSDIEETVELYEKYKEQKDALQESKELLFAESDAEMVDMLKEEISEIEQRITTMEEELRVLLLPKDPNDSKNVVVEIRGAAGGDEANIFAGDLLRMYTRFAEMRGYSVEIQDAMPGDSGGYSLVSFLVKGQGAYSQLKFESGAHRVQRIPQTESGGRIHTSTATVVAMPEADESVDVEIKEADLKIDTYRASGAGGQHVNTTDSAVRMTHVPTGIVVSSQTERSQIKNRENCMKMLKTRIYDFFEQQKLKESSATRKLAVGTGDRSEKIRTYNYPQNRVTDHRIGFTLNKLDQIMEGKLDEIINALILEDQTQKMEQSTYDDAAL